MITVHCTECGQPIERRRYHVALTEHPFCGFKCYAAWQSKHRKGQGRKRVMVTCAYCGSEVERVPSQVLSRNYCSRECYNQWRSATGANSGNKNASWRGGHSEYRGPNWYYQRKAARQRDNNTCQRCGSQGKSYPVHHIRPFRLFSDYREANKLENLITLCSTCHGIAEQEFWISHPELIDCSPFPIVVPLQKCRKCGKDFTPRSGATRVCDACCTIVCAHCGKSFYSRKAVHREVKYCSLDCRNAAVAHSNPRLMSSDTT